MGAAASKQLDMLGDHWASCMWSSGVRRRARPLERTSARIFCEVGACLQENVQLRAMAIHGIAGTDELALEVVAPGLALARGVPLGVDATKVSPLHCDGNPWFRADVVLRVSLERASGSKATTCSELVASDAVQLTRLACEVGGRWSSKCAEIITELAAVWARAAPKHLQAAARLS